MAGSAVASLSVALILCASARAQTTTRVSVDSAGNQANSDSLGPAISADGRYVAFLSYATNLVAGDTNGSPDIFRHDRQNGATIRVSVDSAGVQGNLSLGSFNCSISADGRYVAFDSSASNLVAGDTNGQSDVFVHDCQTGITTLVSASSAGVQGNNSSGSSSISGDGRFVAFASWASNLVNGDTNVTMDVFVHDLQTGVTVRASVDSAGMQGNDYSTVPSISGDGRYVAFRSIATNLVVGDTNNTEDVFVHDALTGSTMRVNVDSAGNQGTGGVSAPKISADGRWVCFTSADSTLVLADFNLRRDVFVHDLQSGATTLVSVSPAGYQGNGDSFGASLSPDGRFVSFISVADNLVSGDTNSAQDVFVKDRETGELTRVSVSSTGTQGNDSSGTSSISAGGRFVAFNSYDTNLVDNDTNQQADIFVRDRGQTTAFTPFCFGDGLGSACPCANYGSPGHGCEDSAGTGGALLTGSGVTSLSADSVQFTSSGELPSSLSIVLQGDSVIAPTTFGGGLRCAGGVLKRLYVKSASGGTVSAPQFLDPSVSAQSANLGDTISIGAVRIYQIYFRDSNLGYCPAGFNVTNAVAIAWDA